MDKIIKWFNNLSIKSSYIAYITISLLVSAGVGALLMWGMNLIRENIYIYDQYQIEYNKTQVYTHKIFETEILELTENENQVEYQITDVNDGTSVTFIIKKDEPRKIEILKDKEGVIKALLIKEIITIKTSIVDFVLGILIIIILPICLIIGCIVCSILFFKYKLNPPLQILMEASDKISENELDFNIKYDSKDEMGQLCNSFEIMRQALYENQKALWRNIEERKRLNSAFSHDLRTPLTVLKGYSEMLQLALENNASEKENMIQIVKTMSNNIDRLERYTYEMSRMQKLEDISVNKKQELTQTLLTQLKEAGEILSSELNFNIRNNIKENNLTIDLELVMQVYENLIANSKRYAQSKILVNCYLMNHELIIEVMDDGVGFSSEGLLKAMDPFYKEQENVNNTHFGLGLHICRLLTEKQGGNLTVANNTIGGAKITANFGKIN